MLSIRLVLAPLQRRTRIPTATGRIVRCVASYAVHNLCNRSDCVPRSIALALATGIMIAMRTGAEMMTATTIATMIDITTIVTAITTTMAAETAAGGSAAKSAATATATTTTTAIVAAIAAATTGGTSGVTSDVMNGVTSDVTGTDIGTGTTVIAGEERTEEMPRSSYKNWTARTVTGAGGAALIMPHGMTTSGGVTLRGGTMSLRLTRLSTCAAWRCSRAQRACGRP